LDAEDSERYECDVSFIGTWSPKKQKMLEELCEALPDIHLRIWGNQWESALAKLGHRVQRKFVIGLEYTKALLASKINLAILSEARKGASSGDLITSRTFHIPATGAFMLHERTSEFLAYFTEGIECACFASAEELVAKIRYYLEHPAERVALAQRGLQRSIDCHYAIDSRAEQVVQKAAELLKSKAI
jgi:spore maturation protein CgeB